MKKDRKSLSLYESFMFEAGKAIRKDLYESIDDEENEEDTEDDEDLDIDPDDLQGSYDEDDVRRIAHEYLDEYYEEFPELAYEYPNWGELMDSRHEALFHAFMEGSNWAGDIADDEWEKYILEKEKEAKEILMKVNRARR